MANTTAAIMAIPAPMDPIRLVGDEEKHATLLYFGETSTLPGEALQTLKDAVGLASGMLFPFGESVVDVTRLGDEVPPALVALLSGESLNQVRNLFLMNPDVSGFRDNAEQFPGFTPHVTLSHPDFADEAIQRALMRQVYRVRFDRLSVWWNDERFDFPLGPSQDKTSMSEAIDNFVAQHALEDDDHIEHHGVKGQKWGIRRRIDSATGRVEQTGSTGLTTKLKPRTGSADQIQQDRIQKKIDTVGVHALSTAELQSYTRRLQMEKDVNRVLAEQSAAQKAASERFITRFVKKQAARQTDRVVNKALDVAVEKALESAGIQLGKKNPELGKSVKEISSRLKPKKGK
jgi:hypothetical protein